MTFENDRTAAPTAVGGDLKVASFNVLNYFTTLGATTAGCTSFNDRTGDPVTVNGGCDPRGAWDPDDLQRQQAKIVAAINALDADVVGLLEIENSAGVDGVADEALGTLVDALNAAAGSDRLGVRPVVHRAARRPPAGRHHQRAHLQAGRRRADGRVARARRPERRRRGVRQRP